MNCSLKTMAATAATLLATLGVAYVAFPAAQGFILASAPILLALICPVMMIAMMLTMRGHGANARDTASKAEVPALRDTPDAVQEA
jgi:fatty acid desaturase